jgi:hypothetical protein
MAHKHSRSNTPHTPAETNAADSWELTRQRLHLIQLEDYDNEAPLAVREAYQAELEQPKAVVVANKTARYISQEAQVEMPSNRLSPAVAREDVARAFEPQVDAEAHQYQAPDSVPSETPAEPIQLHAVDNLREHRAYIDSLFDDEAA